jgi:sulfur-oxidizing protein SoxX
MKLRLQVIVFGMAAGLALQAVAAEVAPGDVKIDGGKVAMSLTGVAGNPEEGANAFKDRKLGNCLACHVNKAMSKELFHGNVGPELDGVAGRYSVEELRAIVVNAKITLNEQSMMPGFYTLDVGKSVREESVGKTVLTAQQVEDVVAYLATLK